MITFLWTLMQHSLERKWRLIDIVMFVMSHCITAVSFTEKRFFSKTLNLFKQFWLVLLANHESISLLKLFWFIKFLSLNAFYKLITTTNNNYLMQRCLNYGLRHFEQGEGSHLFFTIFHRIFTFNFFWIIATIYFQ